MYIYHFQPKLLCQIIKKISNRAERIGRNENIQRGEAAVVTDSNLAESRKQKGRNWTFMRFFGVRNSSLFTTTHKVKELHKKSGGFYETM